jgi:D-glycero-D-manno-heptose 1,7-bisphosphate phosphatase
MISEMKQVLFLDRDGIVNQDKHFVSKIEDIAFVEGIFQLCKYFKAQGYEIVIITNQSGIARGLFSEQDFQRVMTFILEEFKRNEVEILDFFHCPHGPDDKCECRKPLPGLFAQAIQKFNILAQDCISIGDRERDILAAISAGIPQNYLLLGRELGADQISGPIIVRSLTEIVEIHQSLPLEPQN